MRCQLLPLPCRSVHSPGLPPLCSASTPSATRSFICKGRASLHPGDKPHLTLGAGCSCEGHSSSSGGRSSGPCPRLFPRLPLGNALLAGLLRRHPCPCLPVGHLPFPCPRAALSTPSLGRGYFPPAPLGSPRSRLTRAGFQFPHASRSPRSRQG